MKRFLLMIVVTSVLWGCYPGGAEYVEDIDAVYTNHDATYDFATKNTYSMPDKIVVDAEKNIGGGWDPEYMPQPAADEILDYIESNMADNGWTRLPNIGDNPNPDAQVILTPAALKSTTYFYSYWYDWYYGGWGWYYPPYYTVSSYTTGSLVMVIADPNTDSPTNESEATWVAVANGLFIGNYDFDRVKKGIDQAFAQSPYLKTN